MPAPTFHPRQESAQTELLDRILERIHRDLPDSIGLAVTVHDKRGYSVLASQGFGEEFIQEQLNGAGGPVVDAFEHEVPVLSPELWADDRWPGLTPQAMRGCCPELEAVWSNVRGAVAVPGVWQDGSSVVVSGVLDKPADAATVTTLIGYEQLIIAALLTSGAQDDTRIADMMAVLQSRGAIEQAKGAIMGQLRCDAETAWSTLRRASHESNVKLRVLSVALVEHMSGAPAEQPAAGAPIVPDDDARRAARLLWAVLTHAPKPAEPAG